MKIEIKNISVKSIIIITIITCLSFGLGLYIAYKANVVNEQSVFISRDNTGLKTSEKAVVPDDTHIPDFNEDDPLIHLKMLQKDMETFKALMEEVKNELFVTET